MEEKPMKKKKKNLIKTRDHLMVKVINGVTKAGVHKDHKKEANKKASRTKVYVEDEEVCLWCTFPYKDYPLPLDRPNLEARELGYCSVSCMEMDLES
jgi:hypothetical protein